MCVLSARLRRVYFVCVCSVFVSSRTSFFFWGLPLQVGERPENASAGDSVLSHFVPSRVCQCKAGLPKLALFFVFGFFFWV